LNEQLLTNMPAIKSSSPNDSQIVPFGKYKGQPTEALLADPATPTKVRALFTPPIQTGQEPHNHP